MSRIGRHALLLTCLAASVMLAACGGGADTGAAPPATTEPPAQSTPPVTTQPATTEQPAEAEAPPAPLPGLPEYTAGYESWTKLNPAPIPPTESDPHLGTKDVFASKEADRGGDMLLYPDGTIVVKHAFRPDTDFIGLVAVMRKERGADPEHNDWLFVEYTRDAPDEPFRKIASDAVCWSCHMGAATTDYVWVHTTGAAP